MGLSTKQGFDWPSGKNTLHRGPPEQPKPPPQQTERLKCPRCSSTNTKFCYYNNYNKSQPRHFCKSCKRHWTKGGTLRNVPVGGGRKNKRPRTSNSAAAPCFPMKANYTGNNHKNMSNNIDDDINIINNNGGNTSAIEDRKPEFDQFSSLSTYFDENNHFSYQSLNEFDHQYLGNLDSIEESTVTTVNNIPGSSSVAWPGPDTGSTLDLPDYWNWSEIYVLGSSGHVNVSWDDDNDDDQDIKP